MPEMQETTKCGRLYFFFDFPKFFHYVFTTNNFKSSKFAKQMNLISFNDMVRAQKIEPKRFLYHAKKLGVNLPKVKGKIYFSESDQKTIDLIVKRIQQTDLRKDTIAFEKTITRTPDVSKKKKSIVFDIQVNIKGNPFNCRIIGGNDNLALVKVKGAEFEFYYLPFSCFSNLTESEIKSKISLAKG